MSINQWLLFFSPSVVFFTLGYFPVTLHVEDYEAFQPTRAYGLSSSITSPDPLLSTGSFISSPTTTTAAADGGTLGGNSTTQPPIQGGSEAIRRSDEVNPSPDNSESKSRKRAAPGDSSWLPLGWRVEDKVRTSGATAGSVDKHLESGYSCILVPGGVQETFHMKHDVESNSTTNGNGTTTCTYSNAEDQSRESSKADSFAVKLGYAKDLRPALVKLQEENLSAMNTDPLYSAYHYSHPPLVERLRAIDGQDKKTD